MSSSISSFDPAAALWRRFARTFLFVTLTVIGVLYLFVIAVDPWGALPLSPPLPRVPISSNARYSHPAIARSARYNAIVLGTSTARLLRPADLDPLFGARFANLAMNSATAWEQTQLLALFLRTHPKPRSIIIDIDGAWCAPAVERLTPRAFPAWMYGDNPWLGYREMLTPFAVQEAFNQAATMLRLKRQRYGSDGYTSFVPPDASYDPARVDRAFDRWPATDQTPAEHEAQAFPGLALLGPALGSIPRDAKIILFFPPSHIEQQGNPGSRTAVRWAACKEEVVGIAHGRAVVLDMLVSSEITRSRSNYWDPLHYRAAVATRIATLLGGRRSDEVRVLAEGHP